MVLSFCGNTWWVPLFGWSSKPNYIDGLVKQEASRKGAAVETREKSKRPTRGVGWEGGVRGVAGAQELVPAAENGKLLDQWRPMRDEEGNDVGNGRAVEELVMGAAVMLCFCRETEVTALQKSSRPTATIEKGRKGLRQRMATRLCSSDRGGNNIDVWGG
ncbi:hypothetical protein BHE74_00008582 [Ensete ventricosum]|nr:hypothetical protein BHE74_00008582 [Ensete ventricosum]